MKKLDVYKQILRDCIRDEMQLEDILLHAVVLHTHTIVLHSALSLDDVQRSGVEGNLVLAPLTRTHVAELMSSLWPKDQERGTKNFWFVRYSTLTPYELFEDVPESLRDKAIAARNSIAGHDLVRELIEE